MTYEVTFNEEKHIYTMDGRIVPSVTQILGALNLTPDFSHVPDWYPQRGTAVHQAIHYILKDTIDKRTISPLIQGYIDAFMRFGNDYDIDVFKPELLVYNPLLQYAGTLDLLCGFNGRFNIIDYKIGDPYKSHQFQLEGYKLAFQWMIGNNLIKIPELNLNLSTPIGCYGLYLKDSGIYELVSYAVDLNYRHFESFAITYHQREKYGFTK